MTEGDLELSSFGTLVWWIESIGVEGARADVLVFKTWEDELALMGQASVADVGGELC